MLIINDAIYKISVRMYNVGKSDGSDIMLPVINNMPGGYDLLALGEVMLRLDPGDCRIRSASTFTAWEGGGEYNVAKALSSCFGMKTGIFTALADNEVGRLVEGLMCRGKTDTSHIHWAPYDGLGASVRNGINFTERGFGVRRGLGVSDRGNTAASRITPDTFDFDAVFTSPGAAWFHTGGIFCALSPECRSTASAAVKSAKKHGVNVSFDVNYRQSLMGKGTRADAMAMYDEILSYADVVFAGLDDIAAVNGLKTNDTSRPGELFGAFCERYPGISVVASTKRTVISASVNSWSACAYAGGKLYDAPVIERLEILDRVGGGDAFAAGFIYGLTKFADIELALRYGVMHGALTMTTPGDTSTADINQVEALVNSKGFDTVR